MTVEEDLREARRLLEVVVLNVVVVLVVGVSKVQRPVRVAHRLLCRELRRHRDVIKVGRVLALLARPGRRRRREGFLEHAPQGRSVQPLPQRRGPLPAQELEVVAVAAHHGAGRPRRVAQEADGRDGRLDLRARAFDGVWGSKRTSAPSSSSHIKSRGGGVEQPRASPQAWKCCAVRSKSCASETSSSCIAPSSVRRGSNKPLSN